MRRWVRILTAAMALLLSGLTGGCLMRHSPEALPTAEPEESAISADDFVPMILTGTAAALPEATATEPTPVPTETPVPTAVPTLSAAQWRDWDVIPNSVSPKMQELYAAGIEAGNNPDRFSKVGDSNTVSPAFFACFDFSEAYNLGSYTPLAATVERFRWSWSRLSRAAENGKTALDLDMYHWYDDDICWPYESATTCEYRLWQPSIAIIALGTNDVFMKVSDFDQHLRSLVEKSIDRFMIVPILVTKADDLDADGAFNQAIAQVALDYELPLWNLWRAMHSLPNHGLREDGVHPTVNATSACDFSGDDLDTYGWTVRNLTGLQALDSVSNFLSQP